MNTYGYAKDYYYTGDGTLMVKVRVPSIHGPYTQQEVGSNSKKPYTADKDLPYYQANLLPYLPGDGDVVTLSTSNENSTDFTVTGLTGASYMTSKTNQKG